nr:F-box domain, cyclin-like protein [Tanacetum cinerariifolium]
MLILDVDIIQSLSPCLDQLLHEPCPFNNLECLKIKNTALTKENDCIPTTPVQVRNFLLGNSPNANFIMELPQVTTTLQKDMDCLPTIPAQIIIYLPGNSPNAIFNMDVPQVPLKISMQREANVTMAKKMARFKAKEKRPETMTNEWRMFREKTQMQDEINDNHKEMFREKNTNTRSTYCEPQGNV